MASRGDGLTTSGSARNMSPLKTTRRRRRAHRFHVLFCLVGLCDDVRFFFSSTGTNEVTVEFTLTAHLYRIHQYEEAKLCHRSHLCSRKLVMRSVTPSISRTAGVRWNTLVRLRCQAVGDGGSPQRSYLAKQGSHSGKKESGTPA